MAEFTGKFAPYVGQEGHEPAAVSLAKIGRWWQAAKDDVADKLKSSRGALASRLSQARRRLKDYRRKVKDKIIEASNIEAEIFAARVYGETVAKGEEDCLNLALSITEQFLGEVLPAHKSALAKRIKEELELLMENKGVQIKINPKSINNVKNELALDIPAINFLSTTEIPEGKAEICTTKGSVMIDWENEFSLLARKLYEKFSE
jgi:flagellar biosynthesis/type III secretory pathway protein FliH